MFSSASGCRTISENRAKISGAIALLTYLLVISPVRAEPPNTADNPFTIAVAANFFDCLNSKLLPNWRGPAPRVLRGATGRLAAQIQLGAPVDVFLAADIATPMKLEQLGLTVPHSRFSYALGELVLVGRAEGGAGNDGGHDGGHQKSQPPALLTALDPSQLQGLLSGKTIAVANPRVAPYGRAAAQLLSTQKDLTATRIQAENIAQAWQFFYTGNVDYALVAKSLLITADQQVLEGGAAWSIPLQLYSPIEQQAVLLNDSLIGREFMAFMEHSQALIHGCGYLPPTSSSGLRSSLGRVSRSLQSASTGTRSNIAESSSNAVQ